MTIRTRAQAQADDSAAAEANDESLNHHDARGRGGVNRKADAIGDVDGEDAPGKTNENIFLFVPNLIGYSRIALACISLHYMPFHPKYCATTYLVSELLDAVDGQAARALGQTSKFGAVLDMVTDRCTTCCLLVFLSTVYPSWAVLFQGLIALDFASHYIHMYSSLAMGSRSHKLVTKEQSWILHSYYTNTNTLFAFCAGNELFWVCLYLAHFYRHSLLPPSFSSRYLLPFLPRNVIAALPSSTWSAIERITWPQVVAVATFPICLGKQIINVVQFYKASKALVDSDLEERYRAQQAKKA